MAQQQGEWTIGRVELPVHTDAAVHAKLDEILVRLSRVESALRLRETSRLEIEYREDVTVEQAAEEIIELLEAEGPLRPSELETRLRVEVSVVLDALEVLEGRGWVVDAVDDEVTDE